MDPDVVVAVLQAWDRRKVTTKSAVRVLRAWASAKGWEEDRWGNFRLPGGERYHFTKQRIQRQKKYDDGRWSNVKSTSLIDGATSLLIKAAGAAGDEAALAKLEGARGKRREKKVERHEKAQAERVREAVRQQAAKMIASEMPVEFAMWHETGRGGPAFTERFAMLQEQLEAMRRLGAAFPRDEELFNVQDPPFAPIIMDVGPVEWVQPQDGVTYTVTIENARSRPNTAVIEIGATGGIGQRVDPITHGTRMDVHGMDREGDAYLSGYIQRTDEGALGVLFFLVSKEKQRGAGSRILDLWCDLMESYGSASWIAQAVGDEGLAFLERKVATGRLEALRTRGHDHLFRCRGGHGARQQEMF